jgi:hypothetical protein
MSRVLLSLLAILTAFVIAGHLRSYASRNFVPGDFGAFYCAGKVVLHRQDPYRVEPLLSCERALSRSAHRGNQPDSDGVDPAPFPGYEFAAFAAMALLPVRLAVAFFGVLLLAATLVTAYCLSRMSALPFIPALAVAFMGTTFSASGLGQLAPIAIAALAAAALLLRMGRVPAATVAASVALLQPQFGIPVMIAAFVFLPRARLVVLYITVLLALCSVAAVGVRGTVEYLSVLPIHARAELNNPHQYSLTWVVHAIGGSASIALAAGTISYVIAVTASWLLLYFARDAAIRSGAIFLLPAAFAMFGGTFVHHYQISVALLSAIVLLQPATIALAPLAAALLTVPFESTQYATQSSMLSWMLAIAAAWCAVFFPMQAATMNVSKATRTATFIAALCGAIVVYLLAIRPAPYATAPQMVVHHANALASQEFQLGNDAWLKHDRTPISYYLMLKLPMWAGLGLTIWLSSGMLLRGAAIPRRRDRTVQSAPITSSS